MNHSLVLCLLFVSWHHQFTHFWHFSCVWGLESSNKREVTPQSTLAPGLQPFFVALHHHAVRQSREDVWQPQVIDTVCSASHTRKLNSWSLSSTMENSFYHQKHGKWRPTKWQILVTSHKMFLRKKGSQSLLFNYCTGGSRGWGKIQSKPVLKRLPQVYFLLDACTVHSLALCHSTSHKTAILPMSEQCHTKVKKLPRPVYNYSFTLINTMSC